MHYLIIRLLLSNCCMSAITKRAFKYDSVMRSRLIELASLGYTDHEIANAIGIHRNTLGRWVRSDTKLRSAMKEAKSSMMKGTIERGLRALADGAESKEEVKEYYIEELLRDEQGNIVYKLDEDGSPLYNEPKTRTIKVLERSKKLAPNEKAIEILARKYDKILAKDAAIDSNQGQALLTINTSNMTLRELQGTTARSALGPIVAVDGEVIDSEAGRDSGLTPPTKGSE